LTGVELNRPLGAAVDHVMGGMTGLGVHPDVLEGMNGLRTAGFRLITLGNGAKEIAEKLQRGRGSGRV
jgi:2-haloacid dehalogenase